MNIAEWQEEVRKNELAKGFSDELVHEDLTARKLALIHSEVSEALEELRAGNMITKCDDNGKPVGFPSELADIVIRVMTLAELHEIDLEAEIELKHAYNKTRPAKHGGKKI